MRWRKDTQMFDLAIYHQELMTEVRYDADVSGILTVEAFFEKVTERLADQGFQV